MQIKYRWYLLQAMSFHRLSAWIFLIHSFRSHFRFKAGPYFRIRDVITSAHLSKAAFRQRHWLSKYGQKYHWWLCISNAYYRRWRYRVIKWCLYKWSFASFLQNLEMKVTQLSVEEKQTLKEIFSRSKPAKEHRKPRRRNPKL